MTTERHDPSTGMSEELTRILMDTVSIDEPSTTDDFSRLVAGAAALDAAAGALLHTTVAAARNAGATWQSIGATLGMTKQAAQKRFAPPSAPRGSELGSDERILGPTIAFDEMAELTLAGRYGWHSVAVGTNYHRMLRSDTQWEHARVTMSPTAVRQLVAEGWDVIDSGFPYTYLKRDTGLAALQEPVQAVRRY